MSTSQDFSLTKLCAIAMGIYDHEIDTQDFGDYGFGEHGTGVISYAGEKNRALTYVSPVIFDPLFNDAQVLNMVRNFQLCIQPPITNDDGLWHVWFYGSTPNYTACNPHLHRAICNCVANMQRSKMRKKAIAA